VSRNIVNCEPLLKPFFMLSQYWVHVIDDWGIHQHVSSFDQCT